MSMTPAFFDKIAKFLVGRKIRAVSLEADCIVLVLDNGTKAHVWRDDEGNGPGALYFTDMNNSGIDIRNYKEPDRKIGSCAVCGTSTFGRYCAKHEGGKRS